MADRECDREFEVLECASTRVLGDELRAHVNACESCRNLFAVASTFDEDRNTLMREAHPPSAGLVWWRINLRAKREAAHRALRAASFAQVVLVVSAVVAAVAILGITVDARTVLKAIVDARQDFTLPLIALGICMLVAPIALYFVATEDQR